MLGTSVASYLGDILRFDADQQKTLSLCGMSAALSTLLGTPFGAALFAVEVVYGNYILYKRFFYCLASSVTAYTLSSFLRIQPAHFSAMPEPTTQIFTPQSMGIVIVTAIIAVLVNSAYIYIYQKVHDLFFTWSWGGRNWLKPVIGKAPLWLRVLVGVVGYSCR
jgi:CIC family chloride channel protein